MKASDEKIRQAQLLNMTQKPSITVTFEIGKFRKVCKYTPTQIMCDWLPGNSWIQDGKDFLKEVATIVNKDGKP